MSQCLKVCMTGPRVMMVLMVVTVVAEDFQFLSNLPCGSHGSSTVVVVILAGKRSRTSSNIRSLQKLTCSPYSNFCLQVVGCCWRFLVSLLSHAGQAVKTFKSGRLAERTS